MSELDGFVVYRIPGMPVFISVMPKSIGISSGAFELLGKPEHVNVFFDEYHSRVRLKKADEEWENTFRVTEHRAGKNRVICSRRLTDKVRSVFGQNKRIAGHRDGDDGVIFEVKG